MIRSVRRISKFPNLFIARHTSFSLIKHAQYSKWIPPSTGYDTGIRIYNGITRAKVPLIVNNQNAVTWYTCGPTVYDSTHIGHASCYVKLDIVQRILSEYFRLNLVTAMNVTDIDDKIIRKSNELHKDWKVIAKHFEVEFWSDLSRLNVGQPMLKVKVTDNLTTIIDFISALVSAGKAYKTENGSVYFNVSKYTGYGRLQEINLEELQQQPKSDKFKLMPADFALWKTAKENEPYWPSPWGNGRPGWHIECSAMASHLFGSKIDIHAGGFDLRFPHHENEDAQSCSYHKCSQWVNYWMHTGQLHLQGSAEKMSKSLRNTISVQELLQQFSADQFRVACLLSNYRSSIEFGDDVMVTADAVLKKINSFLSDCDAYAKGLKALGNSFTESDVLARLSKCRDLIEDALKDDFNTAKTLTHLLELITDINRMIGNSQKRSGGASNLGCIHAVRGFVRRLCDIFGLHIDKSVKQTQDKVDFDGVLDTIVQVRSDIRKTAISTKNGELFKLCDSIRKNLEGNGIEIKDHGSTSSWNRK